MPAGRLLQSSFFDDIRDPDLEMKAPRHVELPIDDAKFYNYDSNKVVGISHDELKQEVMKEVKLGAKK